MGQSTVGCELVYPSTRSGNKMGSYRVWQEAAKGSVVQLFLKCIVTLCQNVEQRSASLSPTCTQGRDVGFYEIRKLENKKAEGLHGTGIRALSKMMWCQAGCQALVSIQHRNPGCEISTLSLNAAH